jgi:superfamily II DNA or RNA helicase
VSNHVDKFIAEDLGMMIVDEVHHMPANTFYNIVEKLGGIGRIYGLTATDFRADGKDVMITAGTGPALIKRDVIWGIKHGWLRNPYFIVRGVDTNGREYREDKKKNYKAHVLNCKLMKDRIEDDARAFINAGKSVLVLVDEVAHGAELSKALGIPFATGIDKKSDSYISDLNSQKIVGLVGTDKKIGEGVDTKNVDVLILANFVASKGLVWQNIGRGLRPFNGNNSLVVLDYIPKGSSMLTRHGMTRVKYFKEITNNVKVINV